MIAEVTVIPNSRKFSVSVKDDKVRITLKSPPEQNKANLELVKELSKRLKADACLVAGQKSRHKKLEIDITEEEWKAFLHKH